MCYKECCLNAIGPQCHFTTAHVSPLQSLIPDAEREIQNMEREEIPDEVPNMEERISRSIIRGDWVKARYDSLWYLRKVSEVDSHESECLISFMKTHKSGAQKRFQWPSQEDTVWIPLDQEKIEVVGAPQPIGRSNRLFSHVNF